MGIKVDKHPLFSDFEDLWDKGIDCYDGEVAIKKAGTKYLSPTSGMVEDGVLSGNVNSKGYLAYQAYVMRAVFPEIYKEAVKAAIGMMHRKPPTIELPNALEMLEERATPLGESLELLMRRINTRQLITGRVGLLGDIRNNADGVPVPLLLTYYDKSIINWDDTSPEGDESGVSLVVLDESGYERNAQLQWEYKDRARILALVAPGEDGQMQFAYNGEYRSALFTDDDTVSPENLNEVHRQGQALKKIPFSFINACDIAADPDNPPLEGLANLCLAIYRGEADYRQNLFMQSQDTLVVTGKTSDEDEIRTGAGACIKIANPEGDAKFIGVTSNGLSEQRSALENDYNRAFQKAGQLDSKGKAKESGDALQIRMAAQNATLPEIALAGAEGLQVVLRIMAEWFGANPDEVVVKPNLEFADEKGDAQTLKQIIESRVLGAPLSIESIHAWMMENGFTRKTLEEELQAMEKEASLPTEGGGDERDRRTNNDGAEDGEDD